MRENLPVGKFKKGCNENNPEIEDIEPLEEIEETEEIEEIEDSETSTEIRSPEIKTKSFEVVERGVPNGT